ncbi:MAG: LysE family translocator [Gammaproteobacteria bacterium]
MLKLIITIGIINILGAMSPGPDFAIVTRNTLMYNRRAGIFTAIGVSNALLIHITYCAFGLAYIIAHSTLALDTVKILGGCYLVFLGIKALKTKHQKSAALNLEEQYNTQSDWASYRQGFLTNVLNPKAAMFIFAIFTSVVHQTKISWLDVIIGLEIALIGLSWFSCLAILLTHKHTKKWIKRWQPFIIKAMGFLLVVFGAVLLGSLLVH